MNFKGIRVISNAGGINPLACAAAIQETAKKAGVDIKVAVVTGDDIMSKVWYASLNFTLHPQSGNDGTLEYHYSTSCVIMRFQCIFNNNNWLHMFGKNNILISVHGMYIAHPSRYWRDSLLLNSTASINITCI